MGEHSPTSKKQRMYAGTPDPNTGLPQTFGLSHVAGQPISLRSGSHMYSRTQMPAANNLMGPSTRTQDPIVTGTSVLGIKYAGGVLLAADTLGSYGSLAMFKNIRRLKGVNSTTAIGVGGDMSDMQFVHDLLDTVATEDEAFLDKHQLLPAQIHSFLSRVLYNRRNKFDPLWTSIVVAGFTDGASFLGYTDLVGTAYTDNIIATGMGAYIALPLLRSAYLPGLSLEEARTILENAMRVLFYRDCRTINKIQFARVDAAGVHVDEPVVLETNWDVAKDVTH
eukprot:c9289_g1_i1.p1 GENE.c9289_g1_i1~~c9289_g1_i1.p1  ORF type:complete len:280 (+),score=70.68 c9289_g1_i1:2-841(+)